MSPIYAGDGTDRNSSATTVGTGGPSCYSSGGTVIAVQTHGVIHKTIRIPKNPPKNGKHWFLFLFLFLFIYLINYFFFFFSSGYCNEI